MEALKHLLPARKAVGKKGLKRSKVQELALDPCDAQANRHPLVHLDAPSVPVGLYTAAIFIVLCSLVTGLPVRRVSGYGGSRMRRAVWGGPPLLIVCMHTVIAADSLLVVV